MRYINIITHINYKAIEISNFFNFSLDASTAKPSTKLLTAALLAEKSKAVDASVTKGTITKEEGATLKENIKTNQSSCTSNFGEGNMNSNRTGFNNSRGNGSGNGGGMMCSARGFSK